MKLPPSILLTFQGNHESFKVKASIEVDANSRLEVDLGEVYESQYENEYDVEYGPLSVNAGEHDHVGGAYAAVGELLDNYMSPQNSDGEEEIDEDPDDDEDADDDEIDEDPDDDEELPSGRRWHTISETNGSVTRAMEIVGIGCLVHTEILGEHAGDDSSAMVFVPHVSLEGLLEPGVA